MRRLLYVLIVLGILGMAVSGHSSQRMVLGEMFTNWACSPCRPANDELDRFAPLHPDLAVIRYHTWWPGSTDPFYVANTGENTARTSYYGVNAVPWFFIDGIIDGSSSYSSWEALVNGREAVQSPMTISVDGVYNSGPGTGKVTAYIEATDVISLTNLKLHFVITESEVYINAPNGQTVFHEAMRDMLPGSSGELISISSPGDTLLRERDFTLDPSWVLQNCEVVVFVQSDNTKEVLQAAKWKIPIDVPNLAYIHNSVIDSTGNGDGRADPGEDVDMLISLENDPIFQDATNVVATITCTDPDVNITHGTVSYPDIPGGSIIENTSDPFKFAVDPAAEPHEADFDLHVTADPGGYSMDHRFTLMLGRPDVLLVDDDGGAVYEIFFEPVLDSLNVVHDKWDVENGLSGPPVHLYHCVIWFTGDEYQNTLTAQDIGDLESFLDAGGGLILTGQNIGEDISSDPFYANYLHANLVTGITNDHILDGETGDPIGDGLALLTAGGGGAGNQFSQDVIEPAGGASAVFSYSEDSVAAIKYDSGTYRVVYYGFGLEGLNKLSVYSGRDTVLARSLEWVGCPLPVGVGEGITQPRTKGEMTLRCQPNPFRRSVTISSSVSSRDQGVLVSVYDIAGRIVRTLVVSDGPREASSVASMMWDGCDETGARMSSGVYFVTVSSGELIQTGKVMLLK